jgi:hypothetical protein
MVEMKAEMTVAVNENPLAFWKKFVMEAVRKRYSSDRVQCPDTESELTFMITVRKRLKNRKTDGPHFVQVRLILGHTKADPQVFAGVSVGGDNKNTGVTAEEGIKSFFGELNIPYTKPTKINLRKA